MNNVRRPAPNSLSGQVLEWVQQRVPANDVIRIASIGDYNFINTLGNGRFGEVQKYLITSSMVHVTGKLVKMEMFDHWGQDQRRVSHRLNVFIEEFRRLHEISFASDRIANFIGLFADNSKMLVFTEYLPNGSVKERLQKENIPEETAVKYFSEALEALHYLHHLDPPITHRDIKAANLLITISDSVKLANFGLVRDLAVDGFGLAVASEISLDFRGTLLYVAPEVFTSELGPGNRKAYGLPADVWALGCTFIEMLVRFPPYFEYFGQVGQVQDEIVERASGKQGTWLPYTADVLVPSSSESVRRLVDRIFVRDPELRPSTAELRDIASNSIPPTSPTSPFPYCPPSTSQQPSGPTFMITPPDEEEGKEKEEGMEMRVRVETAPEYSPMETLEDGALRRRRSIPVKKKKKPGLWASIGAAQLHYLSRMLYFLSILSKAILYVLVFIVMGLGTLSFFLFVSYAIVLFFRYLIQLQCDCDLGQPQYLIISGILLILLFALLFSCCMVALGEYKFRMANKTLRESRFFVPRPDREVSLCGIITILSRKAPQEEEGIEMTPMKREETQNQDDFYYR